jgi:predicted peptidase
MKNIIVSLVVLFFIQGFTQTNSGSFSTAITKQYDYNYLLHKPNKTTSKKPLIIFLHGSGEKGNDLEKVKVHGPLNYLQNNKLDAFILAPQCPQEAYWESESLHQLIQKIIKENNIDTNRIYLTGLSMGAWGAWNLAFAHPEIFAALVPICGFVDRVPMIENCKIANIPTRIFHGLMDDVVDANYSISIYKKLKGCSKDIELTLFDDANHDSWTRVYNNAAIYEWMFQQIKK